MRLPRTWADFFSESSVQIGSRVWGPSAPPLWKGLFQRLRGPPQAAAHMNKQNKILIIKEILTFSWVSLIIRIVGRWTRAEDSHAGQFDARSGLCLALCAR